MNGLQPYAFLFQHNHPCGDVAENKKKIKRKENIYTKEKKIIIYYIIFCIINSILHDMSHPGNLFVARNCFVWQRRIGSELNSVQQRNISTNIKIVDPFNWTGHGCIHLYMRTFVNH